MEPDDPTGYAELWLSELGAHVPEHHAGQPPPDPQRQYGMHLTQPARARRHGARLDRERGARRA